MLRDMYRRVLTLALRLGAYLCLMAVGMVLAANGAWEHGLAAAAGGVAMWMGGGSLAHLRRLAGLLAAHPAWAGALLVALAALCLPLLVVAALMLALDAVQAGLRHLVQIVTSARGCYVSMPTLDVLPRIAAAMRGVIPLPSSRIPIFSPA